MTRSSDDTPRVHGYTPRIRESLDARKTLATLASLSPHHAAVLHHADDNKLSPTTLAKRTGLPISMVRQILQDFKNYRPGTGRKP